MPRNNSEINKVLIEQAATDLFSKKGYNSVSVDEIAARCHLTKRTVYKYYPSKLALLFSIFETYLKRLNDSVTNVVSNDYPINVLLKECLNNLFTFSMQNQEFMKLFWLLDLNEFEGELTPELKHHIKLWNNSISQQSVEAIRKKGLTGLFANYTPEEVVEMISAINKGMVIQLSKDKKLNAEVLDKERLLEQFLGLLELGLKANVHV